jgi:hypothetical protein
MIKKIIIGAVLLGTVAVLVMGGINRTLDKTSTEYGSGLATGRGRYTQSDVETEALGQTATYQGGAGQGRRAGGGRRDETVGDPLNLAAEQFSEVVSVEGKISSVNLDDEVLIDTNDGQIILEGRALSFAIEQGFAAQEGDTVVLQGFYEDADFEIVQITNTTSGQVIALREPTGRPLWAGGGRTW